MTAYIYSFIVPMTDSTNWRQMEIVSAFDYVITEMVNVVAVQQSGFWMHLGGLLSTQEAGVALG